jgi:hypothetical protein
MTDSGGRQVSTRAEKWGSAGGLHLNSRQQAVAGLFATSAGLRADPAMFEHGRVLVAFSRAFPARCNARPQLSAENVHRRLRLARYNLPGGLADIRAVLIEPDAPDEVLNILLPETGIRAIQAGLRAIKGLLDAIADQIHVHFGLPGMGFQHFQ